MSTNPPQLTPEQLTGADTAMWKAILKQKLAELRVAIPAIVVSFDAQKQTVTAQIALREVRRTPTGAKNEEIAPIYNVPVLLFRAGRFGITLPLQAGDEGMLIFCDMCIDSWWQNGGVQNQLERRRHDLSDCGFFPGLWSQPNVLDNYSTNSLQLRSDDGDSVVDVSDSAVSLNAQSGNDVLLNADGDVYISANGNIDIEAGGTLTLKGNKVTIQSTGSGQHTTIDGKTFLTHQHTGVQSGGSDTGPVA